MKDNYSAIFLSLLIAVVSVLSSILIPLYSENESPIIRGLLVFVSLSVLRMQWLYERSNKVTQRLMGIYDHYKLKSKFSEIALIYNLKAIGKLSESKIEVDKHEVYNLWYDYASRSQTSFKAVNFSLPEETFDLGWARSALNLQREKILQGCTIERIFLVNGNKDIKEYSETINEQFKIGIKVGKAFKSEVDQNPILAKRLKNLGTLDFAIVDDKMVGRIYLKKSRKIIKADLTNDKEVLGDALFVFNEVQKLAVY